ncbi:MAG: hypothetical protein AAF998_08400 [Bacteroidota bacterium]
MFPDGRPYNDATFRKMRSDLYYEIARFLGYQAYNCRHCGELDFLRELHARGLGGLWKREYRRLRQHWEDTPEKGEHYYHRTTLLAYAGFAGDRNASFEESESAYLAMERSLDRYYLISKLRITINRLIYAGIFYAGEAPPAADHLLSPEVVGKHLDDPLITVYYQLYNLYARGKEQYFAKLVESLHHLQGAEPDERYEIGSHVLNYALRRANKGSFEFMKYAFKVYCALLETDNLLLGGKLSGLRFTTVVRYGLALGKMKFVRRFIREMQEFVAGENREGTIALAQATLRFYEGKYEQSVEALPEVERKHVFLDLSVRLLRFRIFFEQEDEELENVYSSLKMKVHRLGKRKYLAPEYLEYYRRVVSVMGKLVRAVPGSDGREILGEAGDLPAELGNWVTRMVLLRKSSPVLR